MVATIERRRAKHVNASILRDIACLRLKARLDRDGRPRYDTSRLEWREGRSSESTDHDRNVVAPTHAAGEIGCPLMLAYVALKYVHIIGASVLLGTGVGIAFFMLSAHRSNDCATVAAVARIVVVADLVFTATAVVAQPITGALLAWSVGYSLLDGWILLSIALYLVTGAFWLPVVWMQMRTRSSCPIGS